MREIKFRAWDNQNKQMFKVTGLTMAHLGIGNVSILGWRKSHSASIKTRAYKAYGAGKSNRIYQPNFELMQSTGLQDKNGVDICEGDVVELKFRDGLSKFSHELGIIRWHESSSAFKWFAVEEDPSDGNNYWLTHADVDWRKVIGNIYENPDLLEAQS